MMTDPVCNSNPHSASSSVEPFNPAPYKPRIRRNFPRTKLGCLTCRSRRKKCDERLPICRNCEKRKVDCCWPAARSPTELAIPPKSAQEHHGSEDVAKNSNHSSPREAGAISQVLLSSANVSLNGRRISSIPWYIQNSLAYNSDFLPSPSSRILFDRYVSQTSKDLGNTAKATNPFIRYVIPLALSDKLYMDCLLALSGSDLSCQATVHPSTMSATWSHYSHTVRGLHSQLSNLSPEDTKQALHLLFLTLGLMHVELLTSAPTHLIFPHLIASRHLIHHILSASSLLTERYHVSLFGHLFELYCVRVLGGSVHRPEQTKSPVPYGVLELDFFLGSFVSTTQYPFYSATFGSSGHLLAAFAPPVASFTDLRNSGTDITPKRKISATNGDELWKGYDTLSTRLREWRPPPSNEPDVSPARATASMIYQNALLIYLHSIFLSADSSYSSLPAYSAISSEIQMRIEICLPLLSALYPSRMEGVILWPSMIFGSCLKKEADIKMLREGMCKARYKLRTVRWVGQVLEQLWGQTSDSRFGDIEEGRLWGPTGLAVIVKNRL
ncbi:fungal-specific transcription factor domain-containing protein [Rhexocercosporidium sp. MPI-PUGE-AT-0058]|nr:fungal-specific transcription factor domain-containing protein [Rhexocercosporidium sp. MPI-PUGE-AT-0058]